MSEENNKRLYEHYKNLSEGNFKSGNVTRDKLIVSDAKRNLADIVKKNPKLAVVKEETKPKVKA